METKTQVSQDRTAIAFLAVLLAVSVIGFTVGCKSPPRARVVRLLPNADETEWRFSVNGNGTADLVALDNLTNRVARLSLQHGDLVLFGKMPQFNSSQTGKTRDWLARYFEASRVAMFVYPPSASGDVFSVPVYHWVAPFDDPRSIAKASFFREGKFLGAGSNGYTNMVREIEQARVPRVFVLGSLYDINRGFGPFESPYERQENLLDHALKNSGTELIRPSELPGL
jgi:hypothetical protein